ncbi:MAG: hypothetical protein ACUZ8I_04535 [Candidatus Scalindua sp.]
MSGSYYATRFNEMNDNAIEYITSFIGQGTPVTIVDDIDDACELFNVDKVEKVLRSMDDEDE